MPFDEAGAGYQGDVVQVKDVEFEVEARLCRKWNQQVYRQFRLGMVDVRDGPLGL